MCRKPSTDFEVVEERMHLLQNTEWELGGGAWPQAL